MIIIHKLVEGGGQIRSVANVVMLHTYFNNNKGFVQTSTLFYKNIISFIIFTKF